jgi:LmbE family N-acetylglucosaminyl deacetylase
MLRIRQSSRVLAIGAHPDDIELGAGGFIHRLIREHQADVHFLILTAGVQSRGPDRYEASSRAQEAIEAAATLGVNWQNVKVIQFPDCNSHAFGHEIIGKIEEQLAVRDQSARFDLVLSHAGEDTHADHRAVHESTLSAVRDFHGVVLLYQSPSTKPNGFRPTVFVDLDEEAVRQKGLALEKHVSQRDKPFMQMSRMRNIAESWSLFLRRPSGTYVEAFEVYKCLI